MTEASLTKVPSGGPSSLSPHEAGGQGCFGVGFGGSTWWRSCGRGEVHSPTNPFGSHSQVVAFDAAGRYALLRGAAGGVGASVIAAVDARTGRVVHSFVLPSGAYAGLGQGVFEDEEHVLVSLWQDRRSVVLRCELRGPCETATAVRRVGLDQWDFDPFEGNRR